MGNSSRTGWINISPKELESMLIARKSGGEDFILLDVRNPNEQDICVIEGTDVLIPVKTISSNIANLTQFHKEQKIVVYCKSGIRSLKACEELQNLGFSNLYHLESGILGYISDVDSNLAEY